jgi:hypothetical protein
MAKPSEQASPIPYKDDSGAVRIAALCAELRRQAAQRNATYPCLLLKDVLPLCDVLEDLADFAQDADCNCLPATERYEAHTCRRCELLARVSGGAK